MTAIQTNLRDYLLEHGSMTCRIQGEFFIFFI